jgi:hypothetical protein
MHDPLTHKPQHNEQQSEIANLLSLAALSKENTDNSATEHIQQLSRTAQAEALHDAVLEKDLVKLETLLRAGVDPLIRAGAILLGAVASRFGDGVSLMLQYVKELPQSSPELVRRQEILLQACLRTACHDPECDLRTVRALIAKSHPTENELSAAIRNGRLDVVIELHRAGANIRFTRSRPPARSPGYPPDHYVPLKDRPLLLAIEANRQDIVEYLIQNGAKLENVEEEVASKVRFTPSWDTVLSPKMVEYLTECGLKLQDAQQYAQQELKEMEERRRRDAENDRRRAESDSEYAARLAQATEKCRMLESFPYRLSDGSGATIYEHASVDDLIKYIDFLVDDQYGGFSGEYGGLRTIQALDILEEQGDLTSEVCDKVLRHFLSGRFFRFLQGEKVILHLTSKGASVVDITRDIVNWSLIREHLPVYQTLYELGADTSRIIEGPFQGVEGFNYSHNLRHFQLNRDSYMESCSPLLCEVLSCSGPSVIDRGVQLASRIALITADWPYSVHSASSLVHRRAQHNFRQLLTNELQALEKTAREGDRGKLEQEIDELLRDAVDLGAHQVRLALFRIIKDVAPFTRVEVMGGGGSSSGLPRTEPQWESMFPRLVATRGLRGLIDLIKLMNDPKTLPPLEYVPYSALAESRYYMEPKQWEPLFEGEIRLGDNYEARCIRSNIELGFFSYRVVGYDAKPWYVSISKDGKRCGLLQVKLETRSEGASSTRRRLMIEGYPLHRAPNLEDLCKELEQKAQAGEIMFNKRIDCIVGIPEFVQRLTMSERELRTGVPDDEPELLTRYCEHYLKLEQQLGRRILDDVSFEEIIRETQTPK